MTQQSTQQFRISLEAAETYEDRFVPALFAEWAPHVVKHAGVAAGSSVLDVATGTGIVARSAADAAGPGGRVVGVDHNEAMLEVARRLREDVEWQVGDAHELPFPDDAFDAVLCQSALMFFDNRVRALAEMGRVARPDGTIVVQVWGRLAESAGFNAFVESASARVDPDTVELLKSYFVLGDPAELRGLVESAGLEVTDLVSRQGALRYPTVRDFVMTEIASTHLADHLDPGTADLLVADAERALARWSTDTGVALPIEGHLVIARPGPGR